VQRLQSDGISVVYDDDIDFGDRITEFMERSVRDSDYVFYVCTPSYKRKADKRQGGVGYENTVITGELFANNNERKFIPVLFEGSWTTSVPYWSNSKKGIDYTDEDSQDYKRFTDKLKERQGHIATLEDNSEEDDEERAEEIKQQLSDVKKKLPLGKIAGAIGVISGLIGILVFLTGKSSILDFFGQKPAGGDWLYYVSQDTDYIHRMHLDGSKDEVYIDETVQKIIAVTNTVICYQTAEVSYDGGNKRWTPGLVYTKELVTGKITELDIPYNNTVSHYSESVILYDAYEASVLYYPRSGERVTLPYDMSTAKVIGNQLFFTNMNDNYFLYVMDIREPDKPAQKISEVPLHIQRHYGESLYCVQLEWVDGKVGNSWRFARPAVVSIRTREISFLDEITDEGIEAILSMDEYYIYYCTHAEIVRMDLSTHDSTILFDESSEMIFEDERYFYVHSHRYVRSEKVYNGIVRVGKDTDDGVKYLRKYEESDNVAA